MSNFFSKFRIISLIGLITYFLLPLSSRAVTKAKNDRIQLKLDQLFDGNQWISPAYIEWNKKRITYLKSSPSPSQKEKDYIYLPNTTLVAPLIDAHQHLTIEDFHYGTDYEKGFIKSVQSSLSEKDHRFNGLIKDYLHKGFLYLRDLGGDEPYFKIREKELEKEEYLSDIPYLQRARRPYAVATGQCPPSLVCSHYFRTLADLKDLETRYTQKIYLDNEPFTGQPNLKNLIGILKEVPSAVSLAFHTLLPYSIERLTPLLDRNDSIEHLEGLTSKQVQLLGQSSVRLIPTDIPQYYLDFYRNKFTKDQLYYWERTKKQQSKILSYLKKFTNKDQLCFGSDFYIESFDPVRTKAFWALTALIERAKDLELKPREALQMATRNCAPLFTSVAESKKIGLIAPNHLANFIMVKGDLRKDFSLIRNLIYLVKEGEIIIGPKNFKEN